MSEDEKIVPEHEQEIHVIVEEELPAHEHRTESALYRKSRRLLIDEHDYPCFSCGSRKDRETHHIAEWCGFPWYDLEKLRRLLLAFDPYGLSRAGAIHNQPLTSVDAAENLIVLCSKCHREGPFAIHRVPFPQWVQQAVVADGHSFEAIKDHLTTHHDPKD